ncbi:MAG: methyl-accepting chemotaxis protein [Clostridia bacterium]|jgi:methyl-accepting chemotaxis protein|nr:methyl-accepting chemotaxis protein [Clostridia bacterium]
MKAKIRDLSIKVKLILIAALIFLVSLGTLTKISLDTLSAEVVNQWKIEGVKYAREILAGMETNTVITENNDKSAAEKILNAGRLLSHYTTMSNDTLRTVAKESDLTEINIVSEGKIKYSNMDANIGYEYPKEHALQDLINGYEDEMVEAPRESTVDGKFYKYGAVRLDNGKVIQIGIDVNDIMVKNEKYTLQAKCSDIGNDESIAYALVISKDLEAIAHSNTERVGITLDDAGSIAAAQDEKEYAGYFFYKPTQSDVLDILLPMYHNGEHVGAFNIGLKADQAYLNSILFGSFIKSLIVMVVAFVVGIGFLGFFISRVLEPIKKLTNISKKVAKGDLTETANIDSKDEIGVLATNFDSMIDHLASLVKNIKDAVNETSVSAEQLATSSNETTSSAEEIANTIEEIANGASSQAQDAEHGAALTSKLATEVENLASQTGEMLNLTNEVDKSNKDGVKIIGSLKNKTTQNSASIDNIESAINELNVKTSHIGDILTTITQISEQTNLLALNASIEAARAGEHGKGFAVVADEIRKLAEGSNAAAEEIKGIVLQVQEESNNTVNIMHEVKEITTEQVSAVDSASESFESISSAINEVTEKIDTISKFVDALNNEKVQIVSAIENISAVSEETAAASEEVSATVEQQTSSIEGIAKSATNLKDISKKLNDQINIFKI